MIIHLPLLRDRKQAALQQVLAAKLIRKGQTYIKDEYLFKIDGKTFCQGIRLCGEPSGSRGLKENYRPRSETGLKMTPKKENAVLEQNSCRKTQSYGY